MQTIIVLNDGETWSTLKGCMILVVNDNQFDSLCRGECDPNDIVPAASIALEDIECS